MTRNQIAYLEWLETHRHNVETEKLIPAQVYSYVSGGRLNDANAAYRNRELSLDLPGLNAASIQASTEASRASARLSNANAQYQEKLISANKPLWDTLLTAAEWGKTNVESAFTQAKTITEGWKSKGAQADYLKGAVEAVKAEKDYERNYNDAVQWGQTFLNISQVLGDVTGINKALQIKDNFLNGLSSAFGKVVGSMFN